MAGLSANWSEFEMLIKNGNAERGQKFTAVLSLLDYAEPNFKRENMMFFNLENFLAFAIIYLQARQFQVKFYAEIYGQKSVIV